MCSEEERRGAIKNLPLSSETRLIVERQPLYALIQKCMAIYLYFSWYQCAVARYQR